MNQLEQVSQLLQSKLQTKQPKKVLLFAISGFSGSGKDFILANLHQQKWYQQANFQKLITDSARTPRPKEVNGKDYYFITQKEFEAKQKNNEYAQSITHVGFGRGFTYKEIQRVCKPNQNVEVVVKPEGLHKLLAAFDKLHIDYDLCAVYLTVNEPTQKARYCQRVGKKETELPLYTTNPDGTQNTASMEDLLKRINNNNLELADIKQLGLQHVYHTIDSSKDINKAPDSNIKNQQR